MYIQNDPVKFFDPVGLLMLPPPTGPTQPPSGGGQYPAGGGPQRAQDQTLDIGGGGAIPLQITKVSTTNKKAVAVQNDLRWVQQAILADKTCDSWLKDDQVAINWMLGVTPGSPGMLVGVGTFGSSTGSSTTNAVAGTGATNLAPGSMLITVNVNGAFFNAQFTTGFGVNIPSNTDQQGFLFCYTKWLIRPGPRVSDPATRLRRIRNGTML